MTLQGYLILSGILFSIGILGVLLRRNLIVVLLSIEIMLNAANLSWVAFSSFANDMDGQAASIFVIAIAACEVAIGLAISVLLFRKNNTIDTNAVSLLKW